uniref:HNH endonuclease n=1 Tax=Rhizobium phage IG49 TaxID=3129228 RepID=A0AAU8HZ17_9CAUD
MRKFCTYIVINSSPKLPPFYVGHTSVEKFLTENYHGSVASIKWKTIWEQELSNNPHLFRRKIRSFHKTKKEAIDEEVRILRHFQAHKSELFVNMSINGSEYFGGPHSEATKMKLSLAHTGKKRGSRPKSFSEMMSRIHSGKIIAESQRLQISETIKGTRKSEEERVKISKRVKESLNTRRKDWTKIHKFISPEGLEVEVKNLSKFCRENDLSRERMSRVSYGKDSHHRGWKKCLR